MKTFGKMLVSFGIVILLFLALNIFNISQSRKLEKNGDYLNTNGVRSSTELIAIASLTENTRVQMLTALAYKNIDATVPALTNLDDIQIKVATLNKTVLISDLRKNIAAFNEKWLLFDERVRKNVQLMRVGDWEAATVGIEEGGSLFNDAMDAFVDLEESQVKEVNVIVDSNEKVYSRILFASTSLVIITSIIAIAIAFIFSRQIVRRLSLVANHAKAIAEGNLSMAHINVKGKDEFHDLAENLNLMQDALIEIVSEAHGSSQKVSGSAEQLLATTHQNMAATNAISVISQSNVESANIQLVKLTKITTSLSNLDKDLQSIAQNGIEMDVLSRATFEKTRYGAKIVHDINEQIESISSTSKETEDAVKNLRGNLQEIGNMISIIRQIADQTNLLALNAESEAPRDGETNKRFTEVADEVKKLTEQSRNAAEQVSKKMCEILEDIHGVIESIRAGSECVNIGLVKSQEVNAVFHEIESMVGTVTQNAESLNESNKSIANISNSILENTQEVHILANETLQDTMSSNRASETLLGSIEEITAASVSLADLSEQLQAVILHFKIGK